MRRRTTTIRGTVAVDTVTYSVEGADEKYFTISDDTNGTLAFTAELSGDDAGADFEDKSSYSITVVATSADATPKPPILAIRRTPGWM